MSRNRLLRAVLSVLVVIAGAVVAEASGTGAPRESVIYNFSGTDGASPDWGVIADASGTLYGITVGGGSSALGNAFSLTRGRQGYTFTNLYDFCSQANCADGDKPASSLVRTKSGDLYGFAFAGGGGNGCFGSGCGLVYELKPGKSGYKEIVLYKFTGGADGGNPFGVPVMQKNGTILGVTNYGGLCQLCGTVFALTPNGSGYTESTLFSFNGGSNGELPSGVTMDKHGTIFGTASYGGSADKGLVFDLVSQNGTYTENILHSFSGNDGEEPGSAPVVDEKSGAILGTAEYGGTTTCGVVWMLTPSGNGYTETVLHNFTGSDGCVPDGPVLISGKYIYGTTNVGGNKDSYGTVFELKHQRSGYAFKVLHVFAGPPNDGDGPSTTPLTFYGRALFGTTTFGGSGSSGTVFSLVP